MFAYIWTLVAAMLQTPSQWWAYRSKYQYYRYFRRCGSSPLLPVFFLFNPTSSTFYCNWLIYWLSGIGSDNNCTVLCCLLHNKNKWQGAQTLLEWISHHVWRTHKRLADIFNDTQGNVRSAWTDNIQQGRSFFAIDADIYGVNLLIFRFVFSFSEIKHSHRLIR